MRYLIAVLLFFVTSNVFADDVDTYCNTMVSIVETAAQMKEKGSTLQDTVKTYLQFSINKTLPITMIMDGLYGISLVYANPTANAEERKNQFLQGCHDIHTPKVKA